MEDLSDPTISDGAVVASAVKLADATCRVDIDGQPAVVTYAGASPGAVAGLVQINAMVPPTARTGRDYNHGVYRSNYGVPAHPAGGNLCGELRAARYLLLAAIFFSSAFMSLASTSGGIAIGSMPL